MNTTNNTAATPVAVLTALSIADRVITLKRDAADMSERGIERFYSSVDVNVDDAIMLLELGDIKAAARACERAAGYLYGILDARFAAFKVEG